MTEGTEITKQEEGIELEGYGDREQIRELQDRLMKMLPGAKTVGPVGALALAQVAISLNLNPLTGEIWAIPQSGGTFAIMTGIKGLRRAAHSQARRENGFYQAEQRLPTAEEIDGVTLGAGDIARACDVYVFTDRSLAFMQVTHKPLSFTGLGIYRSGERTKMEPVLVARKRAEADALKQAFDLPFANDYQDEPPTEWQLMSAARDTALPVDRNPRGLFKVEEPRSVKKDMEDLFGGSVVANLPEPDEGNDQNEGDEEFEDFVTDVLREFGYYKHSNHVVNTMRKLNIEWIPEQSEGIWEALEEYADKRADEKAATESEAITMAAGLASQERMPF